jgi:outer membrane protein, heavy metal efflux system
MDIRKNEDQEPKLNRLTLEELQAMALSNNPTIRQARTSVEAAAGRTRQAGLWPNSTIGYVGEEILSQ